MDIGCILTIGETIEDRQKEINFLNKKLKEYCNQLNVDDVRSLNYSEIKKLYLVAGDYLSDDIKKIYEEKRLEVTIMLLFFVKMTLTVHMKFAIKKALKTQNMKSYAKQISARKK
jgi:hypothetical protein